MTGEWSALGFLLMAGLGAVLALAPLPRVPGRGAGWPRALGLLAASALGLGLLGALWLVLGPLLALAAAVLAALAGVLLVLLPGVVERRAVAEDVLGLVVHLRLHLERGVPTRQGLADFARDVRPGRPLARRVERCLQAVELGWELERAFEALVAPGNVHLERLAQMLSTLGQSRQPQQVLERFTARIVGDLRQELRVANRRRLMLALVVTVLLLLSALMLALLEPTMWLMLSLFAGL